MLVIVQKIVPSLSKANSIWYQDRYFFAFTGIVILGQHSEILASLFIALANEIRPVSKNLLIPVY